MKNLIKINSINTWYKIINKYKEYYGEFIEITISHNGLDITRYNYKRDCDFIFISDKTFNTNNIDDIVHIIHRKLEDNKWR